MGIKFPGNIVFRLLFPLVYGTLMYVLVLIIFDSVSDLIGNFFSREWIFTLLLTYVGFEGVLFLADIFYRRINGGRKMLKFAVLLFPTSILYIFIVVFLFIHVYFVYFIGFSVYYAELYVFCVVYILSVLLFNLFLISYLNLTQESNKQQEEEQEIIQQNNLILQSFKNELDPDFLNQMMESLIVYLRKDEKIAQEILSKLSELYRLRLNNKYQEMIEVEQEIKQLHILLDLLKYRHNTLDYEYSETKPAGNKVIFPGMLNKIVQIITRSNIITDHEKFKISVELLSDCVKIKHKNRLKLLVSEYDEIKALSAEMHVFDNKDIGCYEHDGTIELTVPVFELEDEGSG